ncbi:Ig-like domain-containing protein [Clostridium aciditolerans]|uniref:Ig-like domain-containing protein n=1 Tax=Clostridium aciditolerans TaxID=339861 RepID=A0A934HVW7_9CLOT|nr:Ig-like domain-containing protein [Clostridium aciditolerans]MBI6871882.1 Ig-like domain-containing protein [Clostridium aciditolerans]
MRNFKQKVISIFMTLVMMIGIVGMNITSVFAEEGNKSINVNIAVVGMYNEILLKPQQITLNCDGKEPTAEDALRATTTSGLKLEIGSSGWVSGIQDQKNGTDDGNYSSQSGWMYKVGFMMPNDVPRTKTIKDGEYIFFYYAKSPYDLLPSYDSIQNDFVNVTVKSTEKDNSFTEKVTVLKGNSINAAIMEALKSHGGDFDKASLPTGILMSKGGQYWSYILNGDKSTYNSKDAQLEDGNTITIFKDSGEGPKDTEETNVQSKVNLNITGYKGTFLDEKDLEVKDGETVLNFLTRTLDSKGITYANRSGYIAMIADQRERDRGTYSGWKYSVNGVFPNVGMGSYTAKQGDKINLIFVEGFMDETSFRDIDKIDLNKTELSLKVNGEETLTTSVTPKEATEKINWTSDDENIAKVDKNGKVTGLKEGTANITATTQYTKQTAVCKITVAGSKTEEPTKPEIKVESIALDKSAAKISEGETLQLNATVTPDNAANKKMTWISNNQEVAKIDDNGKVIALKEGTANITVTSEDGGKTASCNITVEKNKPEVPKGYANLINALIDGISPKISISDWAALELNKAGKEVPKDYLTKLEETVKTNKGVFSQATDYERTVLGILGAGGNPTNFGGYNLVEKIYNNAKMESQGVNAYIFGLIALDSANFKIPENAKWTREKLIQAILDSKTNDGGWSFGGTKADPDMTAMALSALAPYYNTNTDVKAAIDAAIEKLSQLQTEKGGFTSWGSANSNSVAMVIIGLCDNGIDPATDKRFIKNGNNLMDALLSFAVSDNSGFGFTDNTRTNEMATEQGLRAIAAYKSFKEGKGSVYKGFKVDDNENKPENKTIEIENLTKDTVFNLGSDAKVSINVTNKGEKDQDASLIIGLFDKDGQFVNYVSGKQTIKKGDSSVLTNMMKLPKEGQYKLRAFVWDDLESMNPFTDIIEIPVK